jgi:DNA uptake protein ComE-like DNA-binding protein
MNRYRIYPALVLSLSVTACATEKNKAADTTGALADTATAASVAAASTTPTASTTSATGAAIVPININTATDAQILAIPGMGPRMLREFKEYRPYTSIEQFRREIGKYVDKAEVARLEKYIVIK